MFRLPKVVVREEGTEASSPPDAQKGGVSTRDRCLPCPWSYPSCASMKVDSLIYVGKVSAYCTGRLYQNKYKSQSMKGPAVKTSWSCEQSAQGQAEGLTLLLADNSTGYFGVYPIKPGAPKPYQAKVRRGGQQVCLGCFATTEEVALCVARTPEGQAVAAERAATAPAPLTSEEARQQA